MLENKRVYVICLMLVFLTSCISNESGDFNQNLKVLDIKFEPTKQGENIAYIKIKNTSPKDQILATQIQTKTITKGWGQSFVDSIEPGQIKTINHSFKIMQPLTDDAWIRLRFYNPDIAGNFNKEKWFSTNPWNNYFNEVKYFADNLRPYDERQIKTKLAPKKQATIIINTFKQFQVFLKKGMYEDAWELMSNDIKSAQFKGDYKKFRVAFSDDITKTLLLSLIPKAVTKQGIFLTLTTDGQYKSIKFYYIKEGGLWKLYISQAVHWKEYILPKMEKRITKHFDIYYFKRSTAELEINQIIKEKERGIAEINSFLGKSDDYKKICIVFFEDSKTKQLTTGHQGAGWATGNTIVEIYNNRIKLDPYHETVHVIMNNYGSPPALFVEGFAVYMSEKLGSDALKHLNRDNLGIDQKVRILNSDNKLIPIEKLITYPEIGSIRSKPKIAYPQAASFVKFLIETYGKEKFLLTYKTLKNSLDEKEHIENVKKMIGIYGEDFKSLIYGWQNSLNVIEFKLNKSHQNSHTERINHSCSEGILGMFTPKDLRKVHILLP